MGTSIEIKKSKYETLKIRANACSISAFPLADGHDIRDLAIGLGPGVHRPLRTRRDLDDHRRGMRLLAIDEKTARRRFADPAIPEQLVAIEHDQKLGDIGGQIDAMHLRRARLRL